VVAARKVILRRGQLKTRDGLKMLGFVFLIGAVVLLIIIWSGR
jgi:hypothetical protein